MLTMFDLQVLRGESLVEGDGVRDAAGGMTRVHA